MHSCVASLHVDENQNAADDKAARIVETAPDVERYHTLSGMSVHFERLSLETRGGNKPARDAIL
jgi:hypothetical protein